MSKTQKIAVAVVIGAMAVAIVFCWLGWSRTQRDLDLIMIELSSTQATLQSNKGELLAIKDELLTTKARLQDTKNCLSTMEAELQGTKASLSAIQTDALHLHNPTLEEVIRFLTEDKTDANNYVWGKYVCSHFARDVNNNAESQGIRCAFADIRFPDGGHAVIVFNTADEGMVYFEPMTDERLNPVIGEEYWRCIEPKPGSYYRKPAWYDDTIIDIVVIW